MPRYLKGVEQVPPFNEGDLAHEILLSCGCTEILLQRDFANTSMALTTIPEVGDFAKECKLGHVRPRMVSVQLLHGWGDRGKDSYGYGYDRAPRGRY